MCRWKDNTCWYEVDITNDEKVANMHTLKNMLLSSRVRIFIRGRNHCIYRSGFLSPCVCYENVYVGHFVRDILLFLFGFNILSCFMCRVSTIFENFNATSMCKREVCAFTIGLLHVIHNMPLLWIVWWCSEVLNTNWENKEIVKNCAECLSLELLCNPVLSRYS